MIRYYYAHAVAIIQGNVVDSSDANETLTSGYMGELVKASADSLRLELLDSPNLRQGESDSGGGGDTGGNLDRATSEKHEVTENDESVQVDVNSLRIYREIQSISVALKEIREMLSARDCYSEQRHRG